MLHWAMTILSPSQLQPQRLPIKEHLTSPNLQLCFGFIFYSSFNSNLFLGEKPVDPLLLTKCRHIIKTIFTFCLALYTLEKESGEVEMVHSFGDTGSRMD